jgi:hypothetical protein
MNAKFIGIRVIAGLVIGGFLLASVVGPSPGPSPVSLLGLLLIVLAVFLNLRKKSRSNK